MKEKQKRNRRRKVYLTYQRNTPSPQIRLEGKWLEQLGFTAGSFVSIQCEEGRLVIEKDMAQ
ncbi:SymE family type I addiction module toxin [Lactonifactor longoviformis]|uniref:SymE family type I addiction module toxin n=1 Tax=Lactonifactor longoviformis TaxID=341220 RepID=UPI0036F1F5FB